MAITWECARCRATRSLTRSSCCGAKDVRQYWVDVCRTINGQRQRHREPVGPSLKAAKALERRVLQEMAENKYLPAARSFSLGDLIDWYMKRPEVNGRQRDRQCLGHVARVLGKDRIVQSLTRGHGQDYQAKRREEGAKPGTINRETAVLRAALTKAGHHDLIKGNPLDGLKTVPGSHARTRVLTREEYARLYEAASPHVRPIIRVAYLLGLRQGEILGLKWGEVDMASRFIRLPAMRTKSNHNRSVPFPEEVLEIFRRVAPVDPSPEDRVFLYEGRPVNNINRAWRTAVAKAELEDFRFHDLRRCAITNLRRAGVDLFTIMAMVGHETVAVHKGYNAVTELDLTGVWKE